MGGVGGVGGGGGVGPTIGYIINCMNRLADGYDSVINVLIEKMKLVHRNASNNKLMQLIQRFMQSINRKCYDSASNVQKCQRTNFLLFGALESAQHRLAEVRVVSWMPLEPPNPSNAKSNPT